MTLRSDAVVVSRYAVKYAKNVCNVKDRVGPNYTVKGFIVVLCSIHLVKCKYSCFRRKKIFRK